MIKNVLCVDDDDIAQFYTSAVIEDAPFIDHADSAYDGQGALLYFEGLLNEKGSDTYPELILLDLNMPIMDGYKCTKKIRSLNINCPIIALTANAMSGEREKCLEIGMNDFILKPLQLDQFRYSIEKWINKL